MPTQVLRRGDSGSQVTLVQEKLAELGYITFEPDGKFGPGTEKAVRAFQQANGLTSDGIVGTGTAAVLFGNEAIASTATAAPVKTSATATPKPNTNVVLQWQSEGADVLQYQRRLVELGYLTAKNATGTFNQPTVDATKQFQTKNGLKVDGAAGPESLKLIYSSKAIAANETAGD